MNTPRIKMVKWWYWLIPRMVKQRKTMQDILDYSWKNGMEKEVDEAVLDELINGTTMTTGYYCSVKDDQGKVCGKICNDDEVCEHVGETFMSTKKAKSIFGEVGDVEGLKKIFGMK